ncbi:MAG TPA: hypothetical protein VII99_15990 [Bacteroidia bacterium]
MKNRIIHTKKGKLRLIEPGIIQFILNENIEWDLKDAIETHKANLELSDGEKFCLIHIVNRFFIPSKKAQQFVTSKECTDKRIAVAFLVKNTAMKLFTNFFIRFFKSRTPMRLFTSEAAALKWLRSEYKKATIR